MEVGFNSPRPNCSYTKYGKRFTLAPRSSKAFYIFELPITHKIVGQPGSLNLGGLLFWMIALTCSVKNAFLCILSLRLTVHKSFKNLAYDGICFMASKRGMFSLTCLSTLRISKFWFTFWGGINLWGKGVGIGHL